MNEFSTNVSTLIQQRRFEQNDEEEYYSLNPLIIRVQFLGLQIAPRKINVENDLAKKGLLTLKSILIELYKFYGKRCSACNFSIGGHGLGEIAKY